MDELRRVIVLLMETGVLPVKYKPHKLTGNHKGQWECHIKPDWLLVWEQNDNEFTLLLLETGTHSDLFWNSSIEKRMKSVFYAEIDAMANIFMLLIIVLVFRLGNFFSVTGTIENWKYEISEKNKGV